MRKASRMNSEHHPHNVIHYYWYHVRDCDPIPIHRHSPGPERTCTQHTRTCIYIYMWRGGGPSKRDRRENSAIRQCHVSMKMVGVHCLSDRSSLAAKFQYNEKDCLRANSRWRNCSGGARTKILKLLIISR